MESAKPFKRTSIKGLFLLSVQGLFLLRYTGYACLKWCFSAIMWVNVKNVHSAENFTQNLNNSSYLTWMRVQRRCAQDTVQVKLSKVCGVSLFQGFILRIGLNSECILNLCFFLILSWNNTKALYGHTLQTFWLYLWHLGEFILPQSSLVRPRHSFTAFKL